MVQIIPQRQRMGPTKNEKADQLINMGSQLLGDYANKQQAQQQYQQENEAIKKLTGMDPSGIRDPKMRQQLLSMAMEQQYAETPQQKLDNERNKVKMQQEEIYNRQKQLADYKNEERRKYSDEILNNNSPNQNNTSEQFRGAPFKLDQQQKTTPSQSRKFSNDQILKLSFMDPQVARIAQSQNEAQERTARDEATIERQTKEKDRDFHTSYSRDAVKEVEGLRQSLPKLEMSLDFARNAIESNEVGAFSLANLGQRLGMPELQTAKGAQLVTAAKENLLGNMSRVSSRAQNKWFEQRLNSMMAQIGQSPEANLTAQEMLEAEVAIGKAYVSEFDRLSEEDMKNFGYERKDIAKRARNATKHLENHIFNRASYRMKEIEENGQKLENLKEKVGKNVVKGTPMTMTMAKLYANKYGKENAMKVAEKNGYYIPTFDEFKAYQDRPREFRAGLDE